MKNNQKLFIFLIKLKIYIISLISIHWAAKVAIQIFTTPYRKPKPFEPEIFKKAERFKIIVDKLEIQGYRWQKEAEKKILIVHGFESRAYNFDRYVVPLLKKGYGVFAMDAKAHGFSEGKTITLPEYTAMLRELEKQFGAFDGYISHSFGGIAICLFEEMHNHPNTKLVLIAPATETITSIQLFCKFLKLKDRVRLGIHDYIYKKSGFRVEHFSIKRIAPLLTNSILWIHDEDDDITPLADVVPIIESAQKNIHFVITRGLGHRRIYKDSHVVQQVIDFL
jgi:pimeloyl-ACP methyl ester carboxylesterase